MAFTDDPFLASRTLVLTHGMASVFPPNRDSEPWTIIVPDSFKDEIQAYHDSKSNRGRFTEPYFSPKVLRSVNKVRKLAWKPVSDDVLDDAASEPRFVIEIQLQNETYCGAYFRTAQNRLSNLNLYRVQFPYPHHIPKSLLPPYQTKLKCHEAYEGLDPCAIWLRAGLVLLLLPI